MAPNLDAAIAWVKAFMASDITWREPVAWEHSTDTTELTGDYPDGRTDTWTLTTWDLV